MCVSLIAVLSCGFLWDLLCFFKSKSHSLHNDHSYLEYFSAVAKCACCMLLSSQSCHSIPYSSFSNSKCPPLLEPHNFFSFTLQNFLNPYQRRTFVSWECLTLYRVRNTHCGLFTKGFNSESQCELATKMDLWTVEISAEVSSICISVKS